MERRTLPRRPRARRPAKIGFDKARYRATLEDPVAFYDYILGKPLSLPLTDAQVAIMRAVATYLETLLICGSKGSKSTISAILALWRIYLLMQEPDFRKKYSLTSGINVYNMIIAPKEETAVDITLNYVRGFAENSWYLAPYIVAQRRKEVEFIDNIVARGQGSSSRAGRGYAIYTLLLDEFAHFIDTKGNLSGSQVITAFMPRLLPFGSDGRFIGLTTPAGRQGEAYNMFTTGKPVEPYILQRLPSHGQQPFRAVFQAPTWELNPLYPKDHPFFAKERVRDPWGFEMEYGAKFADTVSAFFEPEQLKGCFMSLPIAQTDKIKEWAVVLDVGVVENAYAFAMGYIEKNIVKVPVLNRWIPSPGIPVDIATVEEYVIKICERYRVTQLVLDQFQSAGFIQRLKEKGINAMGIPFRARTDVKIYQNLLELVNLRQIQFQDYEPLKEEFRFLQRVVSAGRYKVEAAPGSTDDLSDAVAQLAYQLRVPDKRPGGTVLF